MAENRDFVMARLAAASVQLGQAKVFLDETVSLFVETEDDKDGKTRGESMEMALDATGDASRSIEAAQALFEDLSSAELTEEEPDLPAGDEFDEEEEDEDEAEGEDDG